jgi:hypothetical protein
VYEKTPEQVKAIKDRIKDNFMFSSLDLKDTKIIIDAIVPMKKKAGDIIIK